MMRWAAAKARKADVLLCDTAGRLHNKKNLMEELKKINRVIDRGISAGFPGDSCRARRNDRTERTGSGERVLMKSPILQESFWTKMDGTAKGGIAVAIQAELGIPVKYIGVGETIDDLQKFDSEEFVNALFYREED